MLTTVLVDLTIFHIPGLDVKLHYESRTVSDTMDTSPRLSTCDTVGGGGGSNSTMVVRRLGTKRASLFAWMILQSIPEETIISPHILEFLEQTLEPIPFKTEDVFLTSNPVNIDIFQGNNYVTYTSFPVDVIVYFHMQPSTFRFSCLPVSRVECMLQLPSLDIVFSSKRQENEPHNIMDIDKTSVGGLSVTGCLADFNIYIFHPYGGKKAGLKEAQFSPLVDSERKDSLSINVEFVKFHLTRSRKINFETYSSYKNPLNEQSSRAVIRFSTIVDIGSASFKYDMRRLTEILAFPKAWYRRRIVRRLFLGDLSVPQTTTGGDNNESTLKMDNRKENGEKNTSDLINDRSNLLTTSVASSSGVGNREKLVLHFDGDNTTDNNTSTLKTKDELKDSEKSSTLESNVSPSDINQVTAWETLVLFAFNFTKLNVQMNMGNVMGNVVSFLKKQIYIFPFFSY